MERTPYPSDLTEAPWALIAPPIPPGRPGGRAGGPRAADVREVVNGIGYLVREGCSWRAIPHDLPNRATRRHYYDRFRRDGTWERVHDARRADARRAAGRNPTPAAAVLDSQSVRAEKGARGYDAGKRVTGRQRHLAVDTLGWVLAVVVTSAAVQDRDGGLRVLRAMAGWFPRPRVVFADAAYGARRPAVWAAALGGWAVDIVRKPPGQRGFVVHPRRWVVERTFAWLTRFRRLNRDHEALPHNSETMIRLAMITLMARRLRPRTS